MKRKMVPRNIKASMTVEAVFVVPIVLWVIIALIYLTFYLHDLVRLEEVVEAGLRQGNFLSLQRSELDGNAVYYENINETGKWGYWKLSYETEEEKIKQYLEEELQRRFLFLTKKNVSCEINGFSVEIQIKMKGKAMIFPVIDLWRGESEIVLERTLPFHNPEEVLRIFSGLNLISDDTESNIFIKNHMKSLQNVMREGEGE